MTNIFGAIEAGGTKIVCAVGADPENLEVIRFPTSDSVQTMNQVIEFIEPFANDLAVFGVGSFVPLDPDVNSPTYG